MEGPCRGILVSFPVGCGLGWCEPHSPGRGRPLGPAWAAGQGAWEQQVEEADATEGNSQEPGHGGRGWRECEPGRCGGLMALTSATPFPSPAGKPW